MSAVEVRVLAAPGLVADLDTLRELAEVELAALGVRGGLVATPDPAGMWEALVAAGEAGAAVVALPGSLPQVRRLMGAPGAHADRTVWLDLTDTGPAAVAGAGVHQYGRGVWGLVWAVRHAVHRLRHAPVRIAYGPDPDQWAELREPREAPAAGRAPVAVLLHGGFWRSVWGADLMDALALDLAAHGFAAWNLEYRRPDRHGWAATVADVAAGLAAVAGAAGEYRLDRHRVAVLGHSAGGQLGLRAAADGAGVALTVSLAGVLDLVEGQRRGMGTGAVAAALGGPGEVVPEVYGAADPLSRLPLRVPQLVVQGRDDDPDLVEINRRYVRAARAAGDEVSYLEQPGDHFAVIDPGAAIWRDTRATLIERLAPELVTQE